VNFTHSVHQWFDFKGNSLKVNSVGIVSVIAVLSYCLNTAFRPPGTVVPRDLIFYPWYFFIFIFFRHEISELPRPIAVKLLTHDRNLQCALQCKSKNSGALPQEIIKIGGPKHAKFGPISYNFRIWSRISPEGVKISKIRKLIDRKRFLPRSTKSQVNFGPLTTEYWMWVWTHPNCIYRETIFRPLGVAGPSDFNTHYRLTKAC